MRLASYAARRIVLAVPVLFGVSVLAFVLIHLAPGNVALTILGDNATPELIRSVERSYHLDEPLPQQYLAWLANVLHGNLGQSFTSHERVSTLLLERAGVTLEIGLLAFGLALIVSVPLGVWAATHRNRLQDYLASSFSLLGISIPDFWLGLLVIIVFAVNLRLLPAGGFVPLGRDVAGNLRSVALPVVILAFLNTALITRMLRAGMIETLSQNYVATARAMGVPWRTVVWDDALRNAFLPTLTVIGLTLAQVLAGTVLLETVFSLPGFGRLIAEAVFSRDVPTLQGALLVVGFVYVAMNLLVDLLYAVVDPRIRY
jgi:peptide/nickel transport system permease protein